MREHSDQQRESRSDSEICEEDLPEEPVPEHDSTPETIPDAPDRLDVLARRAKPSAQPDNLHIDSPRGDGVVVAMDGIEDLLAVIESETHKPVKFAVNSHYHLDHTGGNQVLASRGIPIIGHDRLMEWQTTKNRRFLPAAEELQKRKTDTAKQLSDTPADQTDKRAQLERQLDIEWERIEPFYGLGWSLRPLRARIRGRREPAKCEPSCPARAALFGLTRSMAIDFGRRGIRVNCVAPGPVWTPLNVADKPAQKAAKHGSDVPMERPGQPEEVAPTYVFFASNVDSSYITEEVLTLLGGESTAG